MSLVVGSATHGAAIRLKPSDAVGGVVTNLPDGSSAAYLRGDQSRTNHLEWNLADPVPAGWSRLELSTGPSANIDTEASLFVGSPHPTSLVLKFLPTQPAASTRHVAWVYSPAPIRQVWVQKYWASALHTLPILGIDIEPGSMPDPTGTLLMDVPLKDGRLALPFACPAGNLQLHVPAGAPRDGFTVRWRSGGAMCELAGIGLSDFALHSPNPIDELSVLGTGAATGVVLQRVPLPPPAADLGTQHEIPFIEPVQQTLRSATLTLKLQGPGTSRPTFPELPSGRQTAVIFSWDDGVQNDLRCAMALQKRGIRGTYFLLHRPAMMKLANSLEALGMEVGSHTWSHLPMSQRDPEQCARECVQMRKALEEQLGHPVLSFAYPFGFTAGFDCEGNFVRRTASLAGYWSARTTWTEAMAISASDRTDFLLLPVSGRWNDPVEALEATFQQAVARPGGVFHVWGHSWEMATEADWEHLDQLLDRYAHRPGAWYTTQGELTVWNWMRHHTELEPMDVQPGRQVFRVTQPVLHPSLDTLPLSLRVASEVSDVEWMGRHIKPDHGVVNLAWH